ncbi:serine/threonine protein kinase [Streptomyces vietnamensis]|uniref:serine/threonine protein kinase n=1 Tax=Streptomyces vietnamensis TaxID=362257 RepID=UPI0037B6D138
MRSDHRKILRAEHLRHVLPSTVLQPIHDGHRGGYEAFWPADCIGSEASAACLRTTPEGPCALEVCARHSVANGGSAACSPHTVQDPAQALYRPSVSGTRRGRRIHVVSGVAWGWVEKAASTPRTSATPRTVQDYPVPELLGASLPTRVHPARPGDPGRVGPYRVVGRLGAGGMGTVHAALDSEGRRVALKLIHPAQADDDEFRARFRREVELSRRVSGPCLVPLLAADTDAATPWLATEYVPGRTLGHHISTDGPLGGAHLYALAAGTAAALAAIHDVGVVHRDVKPANVILAPSGPRVLDFGIAHALDGTSVTRTGVMTGTAGWISPEYYRTGVAGTAGDVFAWGALIAYAATGRLPFGTGAPDVVAFRVMSGEPDLTDIPDDLLALVTSALAKEPGDRPTAAMLAEECTALLAAQATNVLPPNADVPTVVGELVAAKWDMPARDDAVWTLARHRTIRRQARLFAVVGVTTLVVAIGGIYAFRGQAPMDSRPSAMRSVSVSPPTSFDNSSRSAPAPTSSSAEKSPSRPATKEHLPGSGASATCLPVTYKLPDGTPSCESKAAICTAGSPWYVSDINTLCGGLPSMQAVHLVSQPATGGDAGVSYCIAWTGSSDGSGRNGALLMNAPGYQCGADLLGAVDAQAVHLDGSSGVFYAEPQECAPLYPGTRLTYPAILDYSSLDNDVPPQYVCLTEHVGA